MTKRKPNTLCHVSLKEKDFTLFNEDLLTEALIGLVSKTQHAKKVVSDSPGLVDFAIGLVNSVLNLPNGQMSFFEEFNYRRTVKTILPIKMFWGICEMTFGLVYASFRLSEWQALKMTFFAP